MARGRQRNFRGRQKDSSRVGDVSPQKIQTLDSRIRQMAAALPWRDHDRRISVHYAGNGRPHPRVQRQKSNVDN